MSNKEAIWYFKKYFSYVSKKWADMTSYELNDWFWAMLELTPAYLISILLNFWCESDEWFRAIIEPTPILPNSTHGQLLKWIGTNNDQIWYPQMLEEWFGAMLELTPTWHHFSSWSIFLLIKAIMTRYDSLEVSWVIMSNIRTDSNLTCSHFWTTFHMNWNK